MRTHVAQLLQVPLYYDLDRFDLSAETTLDAATERRVIETLRSLMDPKEAERAAKAAERERLTAERAAQRSSARQPKGVLDKVFDSAVNSATRTVGNQIGSKLVRGILGSLFKGK